MPPAERQVVNTSPIPQIMALCGEMPDATAHRHYLEQLPPRQLQQRLDDLLESEKKHAGRWYGGRTVEPTRPQLTPA